MKHSLTRLHEQRENLDELFLLWKPVRGLPLPSRGWVKAIRESLGMSAEQLGKHLGTDASGVLRLEEREMKKTTSLASLEKAAGELGCKLVYAIVPNTSLEALLDERAWRVAEEQLSSVFHSMGLEDQSVTELTYRRQLSALAQKLKSTLSRTLWKK